MLSQVTEMKEQVQNNRTLGLDEAFSLPAWAALLFLCSCGSTPEAQPRPGVLSEVQTEELAAPADEVVESVSEGGVASAKPHELDKPALKSADEAVEIAAVTAPIGTATDAVKEVEPEDVVVEVVAPEAVAAEVVARVEGAKELTAIEQLAAATRSSVPAFAKEPEAAGEPLANVQNDLRELLMTPEWLVFGKVEEESEELAKNESEAEPIDLAAAVDALPEPGSIEEPIEFEVAEVAVAKEAAPSAGDAWADPSDEELAAVGEFTEPPSIMAQVDGQIFGEDEGPTFAAVEELAEEEPAGLTEFSVTWPRAEEVETKATVEGSEAAEWTGGTVPETRPGVVLATTEESFTEVPVEWMSDGDDLEVLSLERQSISFVDVAATLLEPAPEPALEQPLAPAFAPIARPIAFLDQVPVRARVLAGPLFALDPSGLLGSLVLTVPLVRDITLAVANGEPSDPNLPVGNRLAQVLPVLSEDGAKQLAEEPGLGWIWWGEEVPTRHVAKEADIQTPSVGNIRIVLNSGDYVEGILHAVGQSVYWLDGDLGRYSVASSLVSHIERLPKPGLGVEVKDFQAGDLVRVKLRSGYVEGRLVSAKGDKILLETNEGVRMTLDGNDVERLGDSRTRVVLP